jgi:hypothetical protein
MVYTTITSPDCEIEYGVYYNVHTIIASPDCEVEDSVYYNVQSLRPQTVRLNMVYTTTDIHTIIASPHCEVEDGVVASQVHLPPSHGVVSIGVNAVVRIIATGVSVGRLDGRGGRRERVRGRLDVGLVPCYVRCKDTGKTLIHTHVTLMMETCKVHVP